MKKLIGGAALLFLVGGTGSAAQAGPWCAFYDASTYNCGFHTFEQCLATVRRGRMVPAKFFRRLQRRQAPGRQEGARLALLIRHVLC
jgi:hypothetical protein